MDDFLHFRTGPPKINILENSNLVFTTKIETKTGLLGTGKEYIIHTANYRELEIKFYEFHNSIKNFVQVKGSIHKYYHSGVNYTDFNLFEAHKAIYEICDFLQIEPNKTTIHALEFGVNIHLDQPTEILLNSFINYMGKPYELNEFNSEGYLKRFTYHQFDVKLYDKGRQYRLPENIFRYEIKVKRMAYLTEKGILINSLLDLLDIGIIDKLQTLLVKVFSEILFFDDAINLNSIINQKDKEFILKGINCQYWPKEKKNMSSKGYKNKVNRFKKVAQYYGALEYRNQVLDAITAKYTTLKSTPILHSLGVDKVPQSYTYIVGNNIEPYSKYCLSCGRDISNQKKNSFYCSENIHGPLGKKCRNKATNLNRDDKRRYPNQTLFEIDMYLKPQLRAIKQHFKQS